MTLRRTAQAAQTAHALTAALAILGILLHLVIVFGHPGEIGWRLVRLFSFFTILTNLLVAVAAAGLALPRGRLHDWAARPASRAAVTLHILVVALIFHALLRNMVQPGLLGWWGNMLVHQLAPAAWTTCWLAFPAHGGIDRAAPLRWLIYPLLFAGWTLLHGAPSGWYPYPFMDVAQLGYPAVLRNLALIGLVFLALGYALRWLDGRLDARTM